MSTSCTALPAHGAGTRSTLRRTDSTAASCVDRPSASRCAVSLGEIPLAVLAPHHGAPWHQSLAAIRARPTSLGRNRHRAIFPAADRRDGCRVLLLRWRNTPRFFRPCPVRIPRPVPPAQVLLQRLHRQRSSTLTRRPDLIHQTLVDPTRQHDLHREADCITTPLCITSTSYYKILFLFRFLHFF